MKAPLGAWRYNYMQTLPAEISRLIDQANQDLYSGPCQEEDYPGFTTACRRIAVELDHIPPVLYVNTEYDYWTDTEPDYEDDEFGWVEYDRTELIKCIVGRELAPYVYR